MTNGEFFGPGLSEAQWQQLQALATTLTPEQANWIGGYFTGFADAARAQPNPGVVAPAPPAAIAPVAAGQRTLTVLYGSETGNAMLMAKAVVAQANTLGLPAAARDMGDYRTGDLKGEADVLIIVSTYGEGDPPQPALGFFEFLAGRKAPRLEGVNFAVLALGDSTYEFYCEAGKRLDRRFEELGATRLADRIDCDVDELKAGEAWADKVISGLAAARQSTIPAAPVPVAGASLASVSKDNPFAAPVLENIVLTGRGSSKETRHLELDLEGSGLTYLPGDALGIVARNDPAVVTQLLDGLKVDGHASVTIDDHPQSLAEALEATFEIAALTPRFIAHWAEISGASRLAELARPDRAAERAAFLGEHHVTDVVRLYPAAGIAPQTFIAGLRRLQPRLYSIASSQAAQDGAAHLTVSTVTYELHGSPRFGVVSGALSRLGDAAATLPVYIKPNEHFRLPADDLPIIMIGAGTGVAPYRAFVQERQLRGAVGKSWLFFGERNFRSDFLYQLEWQGHLADRSLTRLDVGFSRDGNAKVYVQHRLREQARDVYAWLQDGAHLYVCGDANGMAPDVHAALVDIVAEQGGQTPEAAEDYLRDLQREHRYSRDVY